VGLADLAAGYRLQAGFAAAVDGCRLQVKVDLAAVADYFQRLPRRRCLVR
jgi:hypothetical protein